MVVFDLAKRSHRENITWTAQEKVSEAKYAPTAQADLEDQVFAIDIEAVLGAKAAKGPIKLNWQQSIVDLMKLLDLDSSLGARTKLAQKWG